MEQPEEPGRLKDRFVGERKIDMILQLPDGSAVTGRGTASVREVSRGCGVQSDLRYTIGEAPYEETDLWSYDRYGRAMHMFGVGSDGSVHDLTPELHWKGAQEGGETEEKVTATWESPETVRIRSEVTVEGRPGPTMDAVGRKRT
ncbi:MAG: hypothetical protein QMD46_06485 [Methanomicrobiales archaeon]|nr:hypothetical protein [Methanomicrobiales archaeon]